MNINWPRWIRASLIKHYSDIVTDMLMLIEGQKREAFSAMEFFELRSVGPFCRELSHSFYETTLEVNTLLSCPVGDNIYTMDRIIGKVVKAFQPFTIYKIGNQPGDNNSTSIGCMKVLSDPGIRVVQFGQVDKDVNLQHGSISAIFQAELEDT